MKKVKDAYYTAKIDRLVQAELHQNAQIDEDQLRKDLMAEHSQVTTEDLVELTYWDDVLAEKIHKHTSKITLISEFLAKVRKEITDKQRQLDVKTQKQKEMVADATMAQFLNSRLELTHQQVLVAQYKHNAVYAHTQGKTRAGGSLDYYNQFK